MPKAHPYRRGETLGKASTSIPASSKGVGKAIAKAAALARKSKRPDIAAAASAGGKGKMKSVVQVREKLGKAVQREEEQEDGEFISAFGEDDDDDDDEEEVAMDDDHVEEEEEQDEEEKELQQVPGRKPRGKKGKKFIESPAALLSLVMAITGEKATKEKLKLSKVKKPPTDSVVREQKESKMLAKRTELETAKSIITAQNRAKKDRRLERKNDPSSSSSLVEVVKEETRRKSVSFA